MKSMVVFLWGAAVASAIWALSVFPIDWIKDLWPTMPVMFLIASGVLLSMNVTLYLVNHWND